MKSVFEKITALLKENNIHFIHIHHAPTYTSEDSAREREEDINVGAKAMVVKIDDSFKLLVLSASKIIDYKKVKTYFNSKRVRLASPEELKELTGLVPGSVPPFGEPVLPLEIFIDNCILKNDIVCFNAGSLTDSYKVSKEDYIRAAKGIFFNFAIDR